MVFAVALSGSVLADSSVVIYYLPFQIETYVPVTNREIECRAHERWIIEGDRERELLLGLFHREEGTLGALSIRAKVVLGERVFLVDQNGFAADGEGTYKLDVARFLKLRQEAVVELIPHTQRRRCLQSLKAGPR